jgi:hypothetical protein
MNFKIQNFSTQLSLRRLFAVATLLFVFSTGTTATAASIRTITVGGTPYNISYSTGTTYADCQAAIEASTWWNGSATPLTNGDVAKNFATALGGAFGAPTAGTYGPLFAYATYAGGTANSAWNIGGSIAVSGTSGWPSASPAQWAFESSKAYLSPLCTLATAPPYVSAISPSSGTPAGGSSVTLTGLDFTGVTGVTIGGSPVASFSFVNDTTIAAVTPAHAAGAVSVEVTTSNGASLSNSLFTYAIPSPNAASIPTLSEWGMIILSALLAMVTFGVMRRRQI